MREAIMGLLILSACVTGPHNGAVTDESSLVGKQLLFEGYTTSPGETVRLEVLKQPDLPLDDPDSWAPFKTTTTTATPSYFNDPQPLYFWSVNAAPVPASATATQRKRWPAGGLVRTRASRTLSDGTVQLIPTFDDVIFGDCFSKHSNDSWTAMEDCIGMGGENTLIAQQHDLGTAPDYLGRKDVIGKLNPIPTALYYGNWGAPATLAAFNQAYNFAANDVTATYYNDNDLGIGREMHCSTTAGVIVACYVSNYSGNGKNDFTQPASKALDDAVHRNGAFATVEMVYNGLAFAGTNRVNFVAYDASGGLLFNAKLDNSDHHDAIPTVCIECHGISSNFDTSSNTITGQAQFLPFDPGTFKFSTVSGFTFDDQQGAIRQLNAIVKLTQPTAAISHWIDGMYAPKAVTDPTAVYTDSYVPSGWNDSIAHQGTYEGIVKQGCRSCHVASTTASLDFLQASDWDGAAINAVRSNVCGTSHQMPQAERVSRGFWASGGRAYLISGWPATFEDHLEGCSP